MASSAPRWSETPEDILGLVIDRLGSGAPADHHWTRRLSVSAVWSQILVLRRALSFADDCGAFQAVCRVRQSSVSADRARFRAVCRSWHLAMRSHVTAPRLLPWIVLSDGSFSVPFDDGGCRGSRCHIPTLPKNARCIGFTDDWLTLDCTDVENVHSYFLHNPFSDTTMPLPELSAIIGVVSELFEVREVLMRSGPHDVVAFLTNNCNYPLILVRPGKGVWLPEPQSAPFVYIIDIAFVGDKLYGITQAEDLALSVSTLMMMVCLASPATNNGGDKHEVHKDYKYDDETMTEEEYEKDCALDELRERTGDDMILDGTTYLRYYDAPDDFVSVICHLVESHGKLLMVRRQLQWPLHNIKFTRKVEVFEANAGKGVWMPLTDGLGDQALFISRPFCKSIHAYGDVERDTIYFIDTGEMLNMKSQTMSPSNRNINHRQSMWMFSADLVV
ncbi:hypothetical protein VPH35_094505 [Triticum aestivum]